MKKLSALLLIFVLLFGISACNKELPESEYGWKVPDYTSGEIVDIDGEDAASLMANAIDYIINEAEYYDQRFFTTGDLLLGSGSSQARYEIRIKNGNQIAQYEACFGTGLAKNQKLERYYFDGTNSYYYYSDKFITEINQIYAPDFSLAPLSQLTDKQKISVEQANTTNFSFFIIDEDTCYTGDDSNIYLYNGKYYCKVYIDCDVNTGNQQRVQQRIQGELDGKFVSWDNPTYYIAEFTYSDEDDFYYLTGYELNDWYTGQKGIKVSLHQTVSGTINYNQAEITIPDNFKK